MNTLTFGTNGSTVTGLGYFQPERVMDNHELSQMMDTNDEWVQTRTGIKTRHIAAPEDTVASMGAAAAAMALTDAQLEPGQIDLVVVATTTNETRTPNAAGQIAAALGIVDENGFGPGIIDVNTACSAFEYALALADQSIRAGSASKALVIGSEVLTRFTDWTDRTTAVLTADGAGAFVLEASEDARLSPVTWGSVPELAAAVRVEPRPEYDGAPEYFSQDGRAVYRWAITEAQKHAKRTLDRVGVSVDEIDVLAFHQANLRIVEPLAKALDGANKIVITDVVDSGNSSAASVPLGLSKAWHAGKVPPGSSALLFGFGGGFTYAGLVGHLPEHAPRS